MSIPFDMIPWKELTAGGIRTTPDGPFCEDLYWQFLRPAGLFEQPGAMVDGAALMVMQDRLPGIDSFKIVSAMGSTGERIFRVWGSEESKWRWDDEVFGARFAAACVRATAHLAGAPATGRAAELVVDVDLSILGRDALRFMEFEYAVREEYAFVPMTKYLVARGRFLRSLLDAPSIFRTAHFQERYEKRARANIGALLKSPRYRIYRWLGPFYGLL